MIIGVPREIKDQEFRVAIVPDGVTSLVRSGHTVLIEKGAGLGSDITDLQYQQCGARLVDQAASLYDQADLIMKVKEPLPVEYPYLKDGLILYTYLHLAPLPQLTDILLEKKVTAIGYETVQDDNGYLPLLAPMSEVAGRMAVQVGAHYLEKEAGGRGILLGGATGVEPGHVTILGCGTVGTNAARIASAMGATVSVLGRSKQRLARLDDIDGGRIQTLISSQQVIEKELKRADLLVGAVLTPGGKAPVLISRKMLAIMKKGAVVVDVAIDQGGCLETSRPTTHSAPTYEVDGIIHYCVANMPGAVPRTSTFALANVTLPLLVEIANQGLAKAAASHPALKRGINTYLGGLVNPDVAAAQNKSFAGPVVLETA